MALMLCAVSNASPDLMRIPFSAPFPVPTMMATGVARPSAQGLSLIHILQYESLCPQCYFRERDKFFAEKAAEAAQEPGADAP